FVYFVNLIRLFTYLNILWFFYTYLLKYAIIIPEKSLKFNADIDFKEDPWFSNKFGYDTKSITIKSPQIDSEKVDDYISKTQPGKISKVVKKKKG
ncbi:hypothetical protein QUB17_11435, partial [Microcoleus sp. B5-C4]|uniref:hypothetical protein n=1 Tax=Microcoleus sp. B5-C4 TaxID=2818675 RepID=UPI002FD5FBD0